MQIVILIGFLVLGCCTLIETAARSHNCNTICPAIYAPICAAPKFGKGPKLTFSSECSLASYNCYHKNPQYCKVSDGECAEVEQTTPTADKCNFYCAEIYKPICAAPKSGKGPNRTFPNTCELQRYNCHNKRARYCKVCNAKCSTHE